jgi:Glycosyl hydrolase family 10
MPTFKLPAGLTGEAARALERTCMAGGHDNRPWPSQVRLSGNQLVVRHNVDDSGSGYLVAPWRIAGVGQLMGASSTLRERLEPYNLVLELARGKVNQIRCQAHDWIRDGINLPTSLLEQIQNLTRQFGQALISSSGEETNQAAQVVLAEAYKTADEMVRAYIDASLRSRQEVMPRLDTMLSCRLGAAIPADAQAEQLKANFHAVSIPLSWNLVEAEEGRYNWQTQDALVDWAIAQGMNATAGPLVDFSSAMLPAWLWLWENDVGSMAAFMCRYVETAVRRYANRIRRWQLTAASNCASILGLGEDELLGLTGRLVETVRQLDPSLELSIGIAQPWGDYMASAERIHAPHVFADTLIRYGVHLAAVDVELIMGVNPRGSYCRDLLEASRILDFYAQFLGVPLRVTLGYPSSSAADHDSDPELSASGGFWRDGFSPESQADWAASFAALALCKPRVSAVQWVNVSETEFHPFPHCGLIDPQGNAKPALQQLRLLRERHLR